MGTKTIIITTIPASKAGPFTVRKPPTLVSNAMLTSKPNPTTILCKRPSPSPTTWENVAPSAPPRKRERLTHLTPDEKLNRRKLKNRIAAQTARDRKKVKMNCLEDSMEDLQSENQSLHFENSELRQHTEQLMEENALLKKQLEEARREKEEMKKRSGFDVALGSAAGAGDERGLDHLHPPEHALEAIIRDLLEGTEQFQLDPQGTGPQQQQQFGNVEGSFESGALGDAIIAMEGDSKANAALAPATTVSPFESVELDLDDSDILLSENVTFPPVSCSSVKPPSPFGVVPASPVHDQAPSVPAFLNLEDLEKNLNKTGMGGLDFDGLDDTDFTNFLMDTKSTGPMWADSFTDLFQTVS